MFIQLTQKNDPGLFPVALLRELVLTYLWDGEPELFLDKLSVFLTGIGFTLNPNARTPEGYFNQMRTLRGMAEANVDFLESEIKRIFRTLLRVERDRRRAKAIERTQVEALGMIQSYENHAKKREHLANQEGEDKALMIEMNAGLLDLDVENVVRLTEANARPRNGASVVMGFPFDEGMSRALTGW